VLEIGLIAVELHSSLGWNEAEWMLDGEVKMRKIIARHDMSGVNHVLVEIGELLSLASPPLMVSH
jgi:hypothetical protein